MKEKWILQTKRADFNRLAERFGIDPVTVRLIVNRGYDTEEKIDSYLNAGIDEMYPPELLKDMEKGADIIIRTIASGGSIVVASDYDADGICSGQILKEGLKGLGGKVTVKTPDRVTEGYGLNERIVREAAAEGAKLLVTCDNGIAAFAPVSLAKELGLDVVITDHHEVPYTLMEDGSRQYHVPEADAVIDPAQPECPYPYKGICGATVAWKLVHYLVRKKGYSVQMQTMLESMLELAAFATITDVCDLKDENRIIVKEGLERLRHTSRPALKALASVSSVNLEQVNTYHIGFVLGPCINAAGRLADAEAAFHLMDAATLEEAWPEAARLKELNDSRKYMTQKGVEKAQGLLNDMERDMGCLPKVMVLLLEGCHESLVGIIAGRIKEQFHRPVIVLTEAEAAPVKKADTTEAPGSVTIGPGDAGSEGNAPMKMLKGSGRSIEAYNMFDALQRCRDLLDHFGGHPMAAGLTLPAANLDAFRQRLNEECGLSEDDFSPVISIDVAMPLGYIREVLIEEFDVLEPTGKGNPKPLFAENYYKIRSIRPIGRERTFYRMSVANRDGTVMDALYFGDAKAFEEDVRRKFGDNAWEAALRGLPNPVEMMLAYYPSVNEYRGLRSLQITVSHYMLL